MAVEASIDIDAPAAKVYDLVSDLPAMGRFSPENQGGRWLRGAAGPVAGARFRGRNRNRFFRWSTTVTVTSARPAEEFAFDVSYLGFAVSTWRYSLTARDGGCTVSESTVDRRGFLVRTFGPVVTGVGNREERNRESMAETLRRLKEYAESG